MVRYSLHIILNYQILSYAFHRRGQGKFGSFVEKGSWASLTGLWFSLAFLFSFWVLTRINFKSPFVAILTFSSTHFETLSASSFIQFHNCFHILMYLLVIAASHSWYQNLYESGCSRKTTSNIHSFHSFIKKNWCTQFWRLKSPTICSLQIGHTE